MPTSDTYTIRALMNDASFAVPLYQRDYSWKDKQVKQLIDDLAEFHGERDSNWPYYVLGQLTLVPSENADADYDLLDGQQRTTTLLLLMVAIYLRFKTAYDSDSTNANLARRFTDVSNLIFVFDSQGRSRPRVTVPRDGQGTVESLVEQREVATDNATKENLVSAFEIMQEKLGSSFQQIDELAAFYDTLVGFVVVSMLILDTIEQAVVLFERINNRGLPLSNADLIKNVLFMSVQQSLSENEYESISANWSAAARILHSCADPYLRSFDYLLKAMLLPETGEPVTAAKILAGWRNRIPSPYPPLDFAGILPAKAEQLRCLSAGLTTSGEPLEGAEGPAYFSVVQHYPVLLSASGLDVDAFRHLASIVSDRVVLSIVSKERPQQLERVMAKWAKRVSGMSTIGDVIAANSLFTDEVDALISRAHTEFSLLTYAKGPQRAKMRFILARISRRIQIEAHEENVQPLGEFLRTTRRIQGQRVQGYDLEHVYPKRPRSGVPTLPDELVNSIGNLVLAHPLDQRVAGNLLPQKKNEAPHRVYTSSKLLLTKSLVSESELSQSLANRELEVVARLQRTAPPNLFEWGGREIANRSKLYWNLFEGAIRASLVPSND